MPCPVGLVVKKGSSARCGDVLAHADAGVGDRQHDVSAGRDLEMLLRIGGIENGVLRLDHQLAAVRHGIAGVDRQIEHRVLQLIGVDQRLPQVGRHPVLDLDRLAEGALQQLASCRR